MKTLEEKMQIVKNYNTFYIRDKIHEATTSEKISAAVNLVQEMANDITRHKLENYMENDPVRTFDFLLLASGVSKELWKRMMLEVRHLPPTVRSVLRYREWIDPNPKTTSRWTEALLYDENYRAGVVDIFCDGWELTRFNDNQERFNIKLIQQTATTPSLVLSQYVRQNMAGCIRAVKSLREEETPRRIMEKAGIAVENGMSVNFDRNMDLISPNKDNPRLCIECSHYQTTNSTQTDKAKRFGPAVQQLRKDYPGIAVIGFIDGPGWLERANDLRDMLSVLDDVFTYSPPQLDRFRDYVVSLNLPLQQAA